MDFTALTKQIEYKWRVQSFSKNKPSCSCVAYIDARDVMNLLDSACGPQNWQSDFKEVLRNCVFKHKRKEHGKQLSISS